MSLQIQSCEICCAITLCAPLTVASVGGAGFVEEVQPGEFVATSEVSSAATVAELGSLKETGRALANGAAAAIATNITLLSACMQALPDLLSGAPICPFPPLSSLLTSLSSY